VSELFVDTSAWACWIDSTQRYHELACNFLDQAIDDGGPIVTTNLVLIELTALLNSPLRVPRIRQIQFFRDLRIERGVDIVVIDDQVEERAWRLWESRPDKNWTMVDSSSFVVMRDLGMSMALTTDHHFEQAGFVRLLR
jgi:predicted nucleic acid-binding protein